MHRLSRLRPFLQPFALFQRSQNAIAAIAATISIAGFCTGQPQVKTLSTMGMLLTLGYGVSQVLNHECLDRTQRQLEEEYNFQRLELSRKENLALHKLTQQYRHLEGQYEQAKDGFDDAIDKAEGYKRELAHLRSTFGQQLQQLHLDQQQQLHQLQLQQQNAIARLEAQQAAQQVAQEEQHAQVIESLQAQLEEQAAQYEAELEALEEAHAQLFEQYRRAHNEALNRITQRADLKRQALEVQHQEEQAELLHQLQQIQSAFSELKTLYDDNIGELSQQLALMPQRYGQVIGEAQQMIAGKEEQARRLATLVQSYLSPKHLPGSGRLVELANRVMDFCRSHQVVCEPKDVLERHGCVVLWLKLFPGTDFTDLKAIADELQLEFYLKDPPQLAIDDNGTVKVTLFTDAPSSAIANVLPAIAPELTGGETYYEMLGDRLIHFLFDNGILVRRPVVTYLGANRFKLRFELGSIEPSSAKESKRWVRSLSEAFEVVQKLRSGIKGAIPGCGTLPKVDVDYRVLVIEVDTSGVNVDAQEQERKREQSKAAASVGIHEPPEGHFREYFRHCYHVGLLGATGDGKTTAIGNIIGVMRQELAEGGVEDAELIITNPSPSEESLCLGWPHYRGLRNSIFGLLAAAVEIQYRTGLNEQAEDEARAAGHTRIIYPNHAPRIYFFDEYSRIAVRWNSLGEDREKYDRVIQKFRSTLDGSRHGALDEVLEDITPKKFASGLLKFCWQVGRRLKIMVLIAGQNLMPVQLGVNVIDLLNMGLICLGDTVQWGIEKRVYEWQREGIKREFQARIEAAEVDRREGFFGLFCAPKQKAYLAKMPAPGQYGSAEMGSSSTSSTSNTSANTDVAPPEPFAPPHVVLQLESAWSLDFSDTEPDENDPSTSADEVSTSDTASTDQGWCDPLDPQIPPALVQVVLEAHEQFHLQNRVIEAVWGISKGSNKKYRAARWKFRYILNEHGRSLPGKKWGEDPDDLKTLDEILKS